MQQARHSQESWLNPKQSPINFEEIASLALEEYIQGKLRSLARNPNNFLLTTDYPGFSHSYENPAGGSAP